MVDNLSSGKLPTLTLHKEEPFEPVIDKREKGFQAGNPVSRTGMKFAHIAIETLHPVREKELTGSQVCVILTCNPQNHAPNNVARHQDPPCIGAKLGRS